ncbi:hypothetical protein RB12643 [Rhodopirellula baltica SH 1]|uniref:Uncharacterized protein n=1 Tax=Rhodopirellula baltica (strain DSM 10527 / NCIMB 13988 / SH1) TaxID=243090 RepID=Q7UIB4_RHOBA|nr:hypothetical protein RB12643 [Rhodopirellula baltica SH 1]
MMIGFPAVELNQATQRNLGHPSFVRHEELNADGGSIAGERAGLGCCDLRARIGKLSRLETVFSPPDDRCQVDYTAVDSICTQSRGCSHSDRERQRTQKARKHDGFAGFLDVLSVVNLQWVQNGASSSTSLKASLAASAPAPAFPPEAPTTLYDKASTLTKYLTSLCGSRCHFRPFNRYATSISSPMFISSTLSQASRVNSMGM